MKDLTDAHLFDDHKIEFNNAQKRIIRTSDWDAKLKEIKEWQEEQERLKGRKIQDDLGSYEAFEQVQQLTPEERKAELERNRKTPYEQKVEEIRKTLDMPDPDQSNSFSSFGSYGHNAGFAQMGQRRKNNSVLEKLGVWFKSAILGKELTTLEVDNNKRLLKNQDHSRNTTTFGRFNRSNVSVVENKEDQEYRMSYEDWRGYLYGYQVSGVTTLASAAMTALKIKLLFCAPSYFILIPALAGFAYFSMKLKEFGDGPFFKNFIGSDQNAKKALKKRKEQKEKEKKEQEDKEKKEKAERMRDWRNQPIRRTYEDDDEEDEFDDMIDDEDSEDQDEIIEDEEEQAIEKEPQVTKEQVQKEHDVTSDLRDRLLEPKDDPNNEFEIPRSKMNIKDRNDVYEFEEDFLRWVFLNRKEFANYHKPKDILNIFAPMIVNYNKSYAEESNVSRSSVVFKNIGYALTRTFCQLSPKFANADEHDPAFFFCIDEIKETGLFYKVKIRLPQTVSKDRFVKSDTLNDTLKGSNKDIVDTQIEMPNDEGYIKIMKLKVTKDGKAFLPLVSTGDVLHFKGMTADGTDKGIVEKMNEPNDLSLLLGLTNAEYAKILDIADNQNTNLIVNGASGSGKSASTGSWFVNMLIMHSPDELAIIILDGKSSSFWENFKYAPHVLGYFGREDIDKYPAIYKILKDVYTYRQNHLNKDIKMKNFYEARKFFKKKEQWEKLMTVPRLIIIGDEQAATLTELANIDTERATENKSRARSDKKFDSMWDTYNNNISSLAVVAREGGITMSGISQRTDKKSFPRALLAQSSIKFVMKTGIRSDADRMMGDIGCPPVGELPTGSGYITAESMPLAQLTTPLFSGDPDLLEEFTRIIGLAWTIIQSYKEDLSKEPPYNYLTKSTKKNAKLFNEEQIEPFNLFNRDKTYREAKEILKTGEGIHFSPDAEEGRLHIDLDTAENEWSSPRKIEAVEKEQEISKDDNIENNNKSINNHDDEEMNDILKGMLSPRKEESKKIIHKEKKETEKIIQHRKTKDQLTVLDLREYFIKNDMKSMPISKLTEEFNMETIKMAINKGIVSIDTQKDKVTLL